MESFSSKTASWLTNHKYTRNGRHHRYFPMKMVASEMVQCRVIKFEPKLEFN